MAKTTSFGLSYGTKQIIDTNTQYEDVIGIGLERIPDVDTSFLDGFSSSLGVDFQYC